MNLYGGMITTGTYVGDVWPIGYPDIAPSTVTHWWPYETQVSQDRCSGKAHVFECDHVKKCQCGAIERVMGKKKAAKKRK